MSAEQTHVVVVGAGIVGITIAHQLARELPHAKVTILAPKLGMHPPHGYFALPPYLIQPRGRAMQWARQCWRYYMSLVPVKDAAILYPMLSVNASEGAELNEDFDEDVKEFMEEFNMKPKVGKEAALSDERMLRVALGPEKMRDPEAVRAWQARWGSARSFETCVVETVPHVRWMLSGFRRAGGVWHKTTVASLKTAADVRAVAEQAAAARPGERFARTVVINAAGLNARDLVASERRADGAEEEKESYAIRGEVLMMPYYKGAEPGPGSYDTLAAGPRAAGALRPQDFAICADWGKGSYCIPGSHYLEIGGTKAIGDERRTRLPEVQRALMERAARLLPAAAACPAPTEGWIGLRPGRDLCRVEMDANVRSSELALVHAYGFGGSGATLAYGAAVDIQGYIDAWRRAARL